jgi:hypothetical protein
VVCLVVVCSGDIGCDLRVECEEWDSRGMCLLKDLPGCVDLENDLDPDDEDRRRANVASMEVLIRTSICGVLFLSLLYKVFVSCTKLAG